MVEKSISLEELKTHVNNRENHILYLLRINAFKSMAAMAADMGVTDGYIRQVKHRATYKRPGKVYRSGYAQRVLQLWGTKTMPMEAAIKKVV